MNNLSVNGRPYRLAVVGGGPRAVYAMERLSATLERLGPDAELEVYLFERSGEFGAGQAHSGSQPKTSYLNRIAGQVSFAADESVTDAGPLRAAHKRPTLHEWCRRQYALTGHRDFDLGPTDWPKRYVHGLALQDMLMDFIRDIDADSRAKVILRPTEVVDVLAEDARFHVEDSAGEVFLVDYVLLLTGHTHHDPDRCDDARALIEFARRHEQAAYVPFAYPLDRALPSPTQERPETVGCWGMGLTAIDVILHLTEGRGGWFSKAQNGGLHYQPSGREPSSILAFSHSGLFTFARPENHKETGPVNLEHQGVFFTRETVDRLRRKLAGRRSEAEKARPQFDFDADLLPVLKLEMGYLHYLTLFGPSIEVLVSARVLPDFQAHAANEATLPADFDGLAAIEGIVDEVTAVLSRVLTGQATVAQAQRQAAGWSVECVLDHWIGVVHGAEAREQARMQLHDPAGLAGIAQAWSSPWRLENDVRGNRFCWELAINPVSPSDCADGHAYRAAVLDFMDRDLLWAAQGNLHNPHKAAADGVWRDLRSVISHAIDDAGLTAASHQRFQREYLSIHNRLSNGAAAQIMEKVRALIECGLLDVGIGPGAVVETDQAHGCFTVRGAQTGRLARVDTLINARLHPFDPRKDASRLYRNLIARGTVRMWANDSLPGERYVPGGIDLTDDHHPIRKDGTVETQITVLGPPAEGGKSFLLSALRPSQNHYVMQDILKWLKGFWGHVQAQTSASSPETSSGHEPVRRPERPEPKPAPL
ncbi:FAD/NAD(P)-binding protein [Pseudomonas sp. B11(2017)]|uniref:FAD/NAD(P)-binding protein n=1 Tax=Pseudomonas sp. B11(2017) TaxID=1981748 RepID=UPI000A1E675D|nr:FAD/NAD(P)-binding protein [Pseudomonas sp. B11(2017)]